MNKLHGSIYMCVLLAACNDAPVESPPVPWSVIETLGTAATKGYERAWQSRPLVFPADHGSHDTFKNEWWYFTGNLSDAQGREFGYQFTLFRSAIAPRQPIADSAWATNQIYLAHAALSDPQSKRFLHDERFSRGAMGLAGASAEPLYFWLDDWSVRGVASRDEGRFAVTLAVRAAAFSLELELECAKNLALHGDQGLSAKSRTPGNASHYYSCTRLTSQGVIGVDGETHAVSGAGWFDHEWSTSALEAGQVGWDWFSLQLSDHSELMLFRLRDASDPDRDYRSGTLISAEGAATPLPGAAFTSEVLDYWQSPVSGVRYPSRWLLRLPETQTELTVSPLQADQEMRASFRYWEGAVRIEGQRMGKAVSGQGYVELTGY